MSLKDEYKVSNDSQAEEPKKIEDSHLILNSIKNLSNEIDNLKTSFLRNNFLTLSIAQSLLNKSLLSKEDLDAEEENVIKSYYKAVEDRYNSENCLICVDRKSKKGDHLTISFEGKIDGKTFNEGSSPWFFLILGDNRLLFENKLYDRTQGEIINSSITIPDDHHNVPIRGKLIKFKIKILYVKENCN